MNGEPDRAPRRPWLLALAIAAAVGFCIGPFLWQALTSLRPEAELGTLGLPLHPTLDSYRALFATRPFGRILLNSLVVAGTTTAICLLVGAPAAFALGRLRFRGRQLVLGFALAVSMFPPIATVSPLYLAIRKLGLLDHPLALVVPYTAFALPLTLWVLTSFFAELPEELYQAALIDGCTPVQALWRVLIPLSAPALGTTAILVFIFAWNELLYALTFTSAESRRTVPVAMTLFTSEHREPWSELAAASVVATLPLIVVTLLFQRKIVAGLTAGGVKE